MDPKYYGQFNGVMLESFKEMDEVCLRLTNLPAQERGAWASFLLFVVYKFLFVGVENADELIAHVRNELNKPIPPEVFE